ncbi:hypothetical protein Tsubulata_043806, partial [Turnera subulata]
MARKSKGRQKLEMVKIAKESNLMVTFSKRRSGLFKKASELSTLCGAEIAIMVFSPGRKVFSFGHPSVEEVLDRYLTGTIPRNSGTFRLVEAHRTVMIRELNLQVTQVLNQMEMEKRRGVDLERLRKAGQFQRWWESPIGELDLQQLGQLKGALQQLREKVAKHVEQVLMIQNVNPTHPPAPSLASDSTIVALPLSTNNVAFKTDMGASSSNHHGALVPYDLGNVGFNTHMGTGYGYNPAGFRNGRKSKGRQKLEMVKIAKESNLMVTFSKRRSGLFKKASELATLCGAEIAILVFSPGRKVFSFGHPSVEQVIERYLTGTVPRNSGPFRLVEAHRAVMIRELNMQLTQKKRGADLDRLRKAGQFQRWWESPVQELDLQQLEQVKGALLQLRDKVTKHVEQILNIPNPIPTHPPVPALASDSTIVALPYNNTNNPAFQPDMGASSSNHQGAIVPYDMGNAGYNPNMGTGYGYNPAGFGNGYF